jgi:hypothetical protein
MLLCACDGGAELYICDLTKKCLAISYYIENSTHYPICFSRVFFYHIFVFLLREFLFEKFANNLAAI